MEENINIEEHLEAKLDEGVSKENAVTEPDVEESCSCGKGKKPCESGDCDDGKCCSKEEDDELDEPEDDEDDMKSDDDEEDDELEEPEDDEDDDEDESELDKTDEGAQTKALKTHSACQVDQRKYHQSANHHRIMHSRHMRELKHPDGRIDPKNIGKSKKLKKRHREGFFRQQVQRIYSSENIDNMNNESYSDIVDTEKMSKALADATNIRLDTIKESLTEAFGKMEFMKSLNEDDASTLMESVIETVCDYVEEASINMASDIIAEAEAYADKVLVPHVTELANEYAEKVVIPELKESADKYLDYVVSETVKDLEENKLIVKSRAAMQSEQFQEKLLNLISEELHIIPEREDEVTHLEEEVSYYKSLVDSERMEKNKSRRELDEARKAIYVISHIPEGISEAGRDSIMESIADINALEYNIFCRKVDRVISDYVNELSESSEANSAPDFDKANVNTNANGVSNNESHNDIIHSIINESLGLLKR